MNKFQVSTNKLIFSLLVVIMPAMTFAQQSFTYTQYMNNQTPLNPAFSLLSGTGSLNTLLRKQLTGIEGAPSTFIFNMDLPVESVNGSAGLYVLNDQIAVEHLTEVNGFFAKSVQLNEDLHLGVSLNAGLRRYVANYSSLDAYDPEFRDDISETRPNLGFGILFYSDHFYIGASVPELTIASLGNASVQKNSYFKNHYHFSGAYIFENESDFKFKPAIFGTYASGVPFEANVSGTLYVKNTVGLGLNYRTSKEAAGLLTINTKNFRVGYSYQFGTASTNLGGVKNSTQEISLSYFLGKPRGDLHLL